MTLRRLRRPAAVLLLVCALLALTSPSPSRAAVQLGAVALAALAVLSAVGPQNVYRAGRWAVDGAKRAVQATAVVGRKVGDKVVGASKDVARTGKEIYRDVKSYCKTNKMECLSNGIEIADSVDSMIMRHLPEAAKETLSPGGSVKTFDDETLSQNDLVNVPGCGYRQITGITTTYEWAREGIDRTVDDYENCKRKRVSVVAENNCTPTSNACIKWKKTFYDYKEIDLEEDDPSKPLPDTLTDDQEERFLSKIEALLNKNREAVEAELDALLKKNLDKLDLPKVSNEDINNYLDKQAKNLSQQTKDQISSKLEQLKRELQEEQSKPPCENASDRCNSTSCCNTCKVADLQKEIQRLEEKADDQETQDEKKEIDESYQPPDIEEKELKSIDFQPVIDLKNRALSKFPFSLLQAIPAALDLLTAPPVAPRMEIDLGDIGGQHTVDLAVFNDVAAFLRAVLTFLIYLASVFCCLKIWSRF